MSWIIALLTLVVGALAGYFLSRQFSNTQQQVRALQADLDSEREEHAAYRREVSEHFTRTALAVNQLTESYRSVHQQLSEGAHALCDNAAAETALAFDQSRLIDSPIEAPATKEETPAADDGSAEPDVTETPEHLPDPTLAATPLVDPEYPPVATPTATGMEGDSTETRPDDDPLAPDEVPGMAEAPQPPRDYAEEDGIDEGKPSSGNG